jgi:Ca2+-binding RTX toxin-like protein
VLGGSGPDDLFGGRGNDVLVGYAGEDSMNGADGNDTLRARDGEEDDITCAHGSARREKAVRDRFDRGYKWFFTQDEFDRLRISC